MLNNNEIQQVRQAVACEIIEVEAALHNSHGTYTYLCMVNGYVLLAHQPVGVVLHQFEPHIPVGDQL
jgi:hypothetical protein